MFTRAYDTIMMLKQMILPYDKSKIINNSALGDQYLNCKNTEGTIRNCIGVYSGYMSSATTSNISATNTGNSPLTPFGYFYNSNGNYNPCTLVVGTGSTEPTYEDYKLENISTTFTHAAWTNIEQTYDEESKSFTMTITEDLKNISANEIIIREFGVTYPCVGYMSNSTSSSYNTNSECLLIYRDLLPEPVTVPAGGYLSLTLTWNVGRNGMLANIAASAAASAE